MTDWVIRLIDALGYFGVFLLMFLETIFPPIPSELILPVAGMRAESGPLSLPGVVASATAGSMLGNLIWYVLAKSIGEARFRRFIERHGRWLTMDWRDVEKVRRHFARFGAGIIFVGRMLPTIRTFISIPAGLVHMDLARFMIWSTAGTAIWSALLATGGYLLGVHFDEIEETAEPVIAAIVGALLVYYLYRQVTWSRRRG